MRERDAGVVTLLMPDGDHPTCAPLCGDEVFGFFDGDAHRLFHQDVLAGVEGADGQWHVELIGDRDDHGVDVLVGEHLVVVVERGGGLVHQHHALADVVGGVADRVQLDVFGFAAGCVGSVGAGSAWIRAG
jgi:hypothetical protein